MTDLVIPAALRFARSGFKYIDQTGVTRGLYTGAAQTTSLGGDRVGVSLNFTPSGGRTTSGKSDRAQLLAFLMSLRGKQNRIYIDDDANPLRGSFPATELFTNADFSNGTGSWSTTGAKFALSDISGAIRVKVLANAAANLAIYQTITTTQFAPYVVRGLIRPGRGSWVTGNLYRYVDGAAFSSFTDGAGYGVDQSVVRNATGNAGIYDNTASGFSAGDYFDVLYISASRCALADGPGNLLTKSEEFDHANWTKTRSSISANSSADPTGAVTMDSLIEDSSTNTHFTAQGITVTSGAQDVTFSVVVAASGRNFCMLQMVENTGATVTDQYFSIAGSGAVGSNGSTGVNWSGRRASVVDLGGGRIQCTFTARKTNAATSITCNIFLASADGTNNYTGNGSNSIALWRATAWPSGVANRLVQSTTAAVATQTQTGAALYVKGLPASTAGLLLAGDWFEIDGQLKMATSSLDSNAAGNGYLQFSPPLRRAVSDNTPIIINKPMGRFLFAGDNPSWDNVPGVISTASIDLEEAFA